MNKYALSKEEGEAIPEHLWEVEEITDDYVRWLAPLNPERTLFARRTTYRADKLLQKANAQEYADSAHKRWGDGRVVARVPLNKFFAELGEKVKEGDREHMTWWLNREENKPFRTFKGKV